MTNREKGSTPLDDVDKVTWTREDASRGEVRQLTDRTAAMTFRVRTLRERIDGSGIVTTYGVPGIWLSVWVFELQGRRDDEPETILSVKVVWERPRRFRRMVWIILGWDDHSGPRQSGDTLSGTWRCSAWTSAYATMPSSR